MEINVKIYLPWYVAKTLLTWNVCLTRSCLRKCRVAIPLHQWQGPSNSASQDLGPGRGVKRWPVVWGWNIGLELTWNSWLRREQKPVIFVKRDGACGSMTDASEDSLWQKWYTLQWNLFGKQQTIVGHRLHNNGIPATVVKRHWWTCAEGGFIAFGCWPVVDVWLLLLGVDDIPHAHGSQFMLRLRWSKQRRTDKWVGRRQRRMGRAWTKDNPEPRTRLMNLVMQG